ncbi:D-hexose-6-phosphate mutarotase [Herbaspirillum sp.]|jgi:glucose-6-phosphate 1-epimerase|uniref:D-hexose-6-phosphate mutarotase n=1 Tax=Herbaspirillum TaxID=963 RepID=UPI00258D4C52|nr:D-hexose-6-phosphate mutarotase [Herbaspirillum sp.]MCP3655413.1 D-hexose-6-phosphate mutarotase [Herbaspirillum sp.]MCP3947510.1 D-hexose-6-phosphate mutarotase [Herbaspirillum sp.]MCP3947537.1 D-hexose-6-phosphate mutarotase [Herbaspirillum sp.]MCP4033094.1 D-hexose-6-phosphate mutarotase [Herbaspirillum sp.]MCP4556805.1 D-hexose-6-phosphate mutarotase [Herbaspirillum sp.]
MSLIDEQEVPPDLPHIQRIEVNQLQCLRVQTERAELLIAEQGAQVLRYQVHGQEPVIWMSEEAAFEAGNSVRGGIPVCWPWFGDLMRNPPQVQALHAGGRLPAHGLVRSIPWLLMENAIEGDTVRLVLAIPPTTESPALRHLPPGIELRLEILLDDRLHLKLTTRNNSEQHIALTQALHSYFAVSSIHNVTVDGLEGQRYIETLEGWAEREQKRPLVVSSETDRIYLDLPPHLVIRDEGWNRRIHIEASGSTSAVVWNPWVSKARRLSQFADDAWQRMLCIETANVMDDLVELEPGAEHTMGVSIWGETLGG